MKSSIGLIVFLLILLSGTSNAQVARNAVEASQNREEIRIGEAQLERDIIELE